MIGLLAVGIPAAAVLFALLYRRPQNGLLLVAALTPLHGLLTILPGGPSLTGWKEGVLVLTLLATFVTPNRDRTMPPSMPWWPAAVAWVAIGTLSALLMSGPAAVTALKITYFYLIIPIILWRTPFDARDRDRLVTILMGTTAFGAVVGLAQQVLGADRLVALGYSYDEHIRTTGGILRSFGTFTGPFALGLFVMIGLVVGGAVALADPGRLRNTLFLCATPVMLLGMGVTIVRASYIGLAAALLWLAIHRHRALLVLFGAGAVALPVALLFVPGSVTSALFSSSSLGERGDGWADTVSSLFVHPFGQGLGATGAAADKAAELADPLYSTLSLDAAIALGRIPYQPDNYYMKLMVELGPIGLWIFGLLLVSAAVSTLRASRLLHGQDSALALGVSASVIAAAVASTVSTYFEIFPLDVYFWLLLGTVGCALTQQLSSRSEPGSDSGPSRCAPAAAGSRHTLASS